MCGSRRQRRTSLAEPICGGAIAVGKDATIRRSPSAVCEQIHRDPLIRCGVDAETVAFQRSHFTPLMLARKVREMSDAAPLPSDA